MFSILSQEGMIQIHSSNQCLLIMRRPRLTGIKAYMARRIKVHGDLVMAQRLEQFFEKAEGREVRS